METTACFSETYSVTIHKDQKIEAVYTYDPEELARVIDMYKKWFAEGDAKIMGLDMEYIKDEDLKDKRMAVIQLAMRHHVLVYQCASTDHWKCSCYISDFLRHRGITFATVDNTIDKVVFRQTWPEVIIPDNFYVDLQHLYRLPGYYKVGTAVMAADLIDPWYAEMKKKLPSEAHDNWQCKPLDKINKDYAAIDAFVAFELYRVILERQKAGVPVVGVPVGLKFQAKGWSASRSATWTQVSR